MSHICLEKCRNLFFEILIFEILFFEIFKMILKKLKMLIRNDSINNNNKLGTLISSII